MSERPTRMHRLGRALDDARRFTANLIFLAILVGLVALAVSAIRGRPSIPKGAALVLNPKGVLVEQLSGAPGSRIAGRLAGMPTGPSQVLVRDVLDAVRLAKDDERIDALYLDVDSLSGGLTKLRDVGKALVDFKTSGKPVVAYTEGLTQGPYYLLAHADETYLHPDGLFILQGFGSFRPFYKEGLDRYGIDVHVFRVGEYKSAVEPFMRDDMSPEAREARLDVYGDLWRVWLADVAAARERDVDEVRQWIDTWPEHLRAADGDIAKAALDAGLVDTLGHRDEARARMIELVGENDDGHTFEQVSYATYLAARADERDPGGSGDGVAVVVAVGDILDGSQPPGRIGGASTSRLIRRAREDEKMKAVVVRVDSGGGSAFASEVVRRECELVREAGKPLVVSMGSVAASGGYWISATSDEIWATPTTITGSIGIFAMFPTVDRALARYLGVHLDGVGTTPWSDPVNPGRPLAPEVAASIQLAIEEGYRDFVDLVSEARGQSWDEVDRLARGRIWSGEDALELGLVDQIGDLQDAIASAARRAELEEGYPVYYVEPERKLTVRLLEGLLAAASVGQDPAPLGGPAPPVVQTLRSIEDELERLALWNDPRGHYAHCLCDDQSF